MNWSAMFGFLAVTCLVMCVAIVWALRRPGVNTSRTEFEFGFNIMLLLIVGFVIFGALCALFWGK